VITKICWGRKKGKSNFRTLINYIVGDKGEKKETNRAIYIGTRNTFSDMSENYWGIALEMSGLGISNTRIKDPLYHFVLSFRPDETPTNAQVDEAVDIALQTLGLSNCKTFFGLQTDNGIHHIHVCVCKVDPETGRAIRPGNGWDETALREAANEIELKQGWELTGNGSRLKDENGRVKRKQIKDPPPLKTGAQDFEAHMGEKSAQTLAIEQAAGLIRESRSWKELHEKLHSAGFEYRKKGSGAVIGVNGIFVKASDAGRDCSLSQLENRIGGYTETNVESRPLSASEGVEAERSLCAEAEEKKAKAEGSKGGQRYKREPTKQTAATQKTLTAWQRYQHYREDFKDKKARRNAVFERQRNEREELKKLHKQQRNEIYKRSWKGQGKQLNLKRMSIASLQLKERLLLKEKQKEAEMPFLDKFLSYRKWLEKNEPERIKDLRNWKTGPKGAKAMNEKANTADGEQNLQFSTQGTDQSHKSLPELNEIPDKRKKVEYDLPPSAQNINVPKAAETKEVKAMDEKANTANEEQKPIFSTQGADQAHKPLPELADIPDENMKMEYGSSSPTQKASEPKELGYQCTQSDDGETLSYSFYGESVAFIEKKDSVKVIKVDETAILAAMIVAQNKWGSIKVDGSTEQMDMCAELAKKYQIKLHFPEKYLEER
jgi:hypothetical protein